MTGILDHADVERLCGHSRRYGFRWVSMITSIPPIDLLRLLSRIPCRAEFVTVARSWLDAHGVVLDASTKATRPACPPVRTPGCAR